MAHLESWKALQTHYDTTAKNFNLKEMFAKDPERFDSMNATFGNIPHETLPLILLDYSKNLISKETFKLLMDLVKEADVDEWRNKMFHGEKINPTYV